MLGSLGPTRGSPENTAAEAIRHAEHSVQADSFVNGECPAYFCRLPTFYFILTRLQNERVLRHHEPAYGKRRSPQRLGRCSVYACTAALLLLLRCSRPRSKPQRCVVAVVRRSSSSPAVVAEVPTFRQSVVHSVVQSLYGELWAVGGGRWAVGD